MEAPGHWGSFKSQLRYSSSGVFCTSSVRAVGNYMWDFLCSWDLWRTWLLVTSNTFVIGLFSFFTVTVMGLFLFLHQAFQIMLSLEFSHAMFLTDFVCILQHSSQCGFTLAIDSYFLALKVLIVFNNINSNNNNKSYLFSS